MQGSLIADEGSVERKRMFRRSSAASFLSLAAAMACIVSLGIWGAVRDLTRIRDSLLNGEIAEMKSHAERTVRNIESALVAKKIDGVNHLHDGEGLLNHWKTGILKTEKWSYAAVEDANRAIVAHSNPALEGGQLASDWYERVVPVVGSDVVETRFLALTGGQHVFDMRLPIVFNGQTVGVYHAGLDADWFEAAVAADQEHALIGWTIVVGGTALVVLLAVGSLYLITRQAAALQHRLDRADFRRVSELSQLIVGLAHEVRNPLNAIRLNLHAIGRVHRGEARLADDEMAAILRESVWEIGRVSALIAEMLGFARSEPPCLEVVDLNVEVRGALDLVKNVMEDHHVAVVARLPAGPHFVRIDRGRLRQVLLNLLNNAREAVGKGGRIEIEVSRDGGDLLIVASDNGPGVPVAQRGRIFEPFYSTKELGIGLGLALVKRFVEESGGSIVYDTEHETGSRFLIRIPEAVAPTPHEILS